MSLPKGLPCMKFQCFMYPDINLDVSLKIIKPLTELASNCKRCWLLLASSFINLKADRQIASS